jgi:hypothetical protein
MKFDYYTYHISEHLLPALINGDYSGLDELSNDEQYLTHFIDTLPVSGHFDIVEGTENFIRCEVTDLHANCYEVRLYFQPQEATQ